MTPEIHTITTVAEFERMKNQWDRLVLAMATPTPFMLHSWLGRAVTLRRLSQAKS